MESQLPNLGLELGFMYASWALGAIGGGVFTILVAIKTKTFLSRYVLGALLLWGFAQNIFPTSGLHRPLIEIASDDQLRVKLIANCLAAVLYFGLTAYFYWKYVVPRKEQRE